MLQPREFPSGKAAKAEEGVLPRRPIIAKRYSSQGGAPPPERMVPRRGLEPPTSRLGILRSVQVSYRGVIGQWRKNTITGGWGQGVAPTISAQGNARFY